MYKIQLLRFIFTQSDENAKTKDLQRCWVKLLNNFHGYQIIYKHEN